MNDLQITGDAGKRQPTMLKELGKWLWGARTVCPHCGGGLPLLRSPDSPRTLHGIVCPQCDSALVPRVQMEPREAIFSLLLCGSAVLAWQGRMVLPELVLGLALASLALVLLLRSQFTGRLVVADAALERRDELDAAADHWSAELRRKPLHAVSRIQAVRIAGAHNGRDRRLL
jgi:hypothetical protein